MSCAILPFNLAFGLTPTQSSETRAMEYFLLLGQKKSFLLLEKIPWETEKQGHEAKVNISDNQHDPSFGAINKDHLIYVSQT